MGRKRKSTEFYDVSATSVHTSHVGDVLMQDAMTPEDDNCFGANTRRQQQVNGTSTTGSGSSANARERARMRVLSRAFVRLKTTLPWVPVDTKLSKLDTLRLATCYIAHLRHVLADDADSATDNDVTTVTANTSDDSKTSSSPPATFPVNLTWPYSFGPRQANDCRTNHRTGKFAVTSSSPPAANSDFALS